MKKTSVLALSLLFALMLSVPAQAGKDDLKTGFAGLSWGDSVSQLRGDKSPVEEEELSQVAGLAAFSVENVTLGGLEIDEVQYYFFKDRFTQAILKHSDFQALTEALGEEYGKADMEQANGMLSWVVIIDAANNEMATIGTVPDQDLAAAVNTKYFIEMMEEVSK